MQLEILERGKHCVIGAFGPVAISVWRGPVTVAALDAIARTSERVRAQNPGGDIALSIASILVTPPDAAARKRIVEIRSAPMAPGFRGSVVVLAGDGFWASVMRSVLASLNLLGKSPNELHVRTLAQAVEKAHEMLPVIDAAQLLAALEEIAKDAGVKV